MRANAGDFNEQVTIVGNWGSLPLGNLGDSIEKHPSKLSHLRGEEAKVFFH